MIIAGMATIPGREESCKDAIESIAEQVDLLFVIHNGVDGKPIYKDQGHYNLYEFWMPGGDENKFEPHHLFSGKTKFYFSLDDDLIYPPDYVNNTLAQFTDKKEILTYHGRTIEGKVSSYYRGAKNRFYCLGEEKEDMQINVPGTGVMCFRPKDFILSANDFPAEFPLMSDIHVGIAAQKQRVPIRALKHSGDWIKYNGQVKPETTIYERFKNADSLQTERVNSMDWKIYT